MNVLDIKTRMRNVGVRIVDMRNKCVIAPFHLACSHYSRERELICDIGQNLVDDRVCCGCSSYDGGSIIALDWGNILSFQNYPFKTQYSLEQIKKLINQKNNFN